MAEDIPSNLRASLQHARSSNVLPQVTQFTKGRVTAQIRAPHHVLPSENNMAPVSNGLKAAVYSLFKQHRYTRTRVLVKLLQSTACESTTI